MLEDDGLQLDDVGPWAKDKHERLFKYVDISRGARRKFAKGSGGATYIDLYCGSGRAVIRDNGEMIDRSPLVAFKCARNGGVPFSEIYIADDDSEKCKTAAQRIKNAGGVANTEVGRAEEAAARIVARLNKYGLHFVFLDPYKLDDLPFSVIENFQSTETIDMLIHVSALDLQRNLDAYSMSADGPLDHFAPGWREVVDLKQTKSATRAAYIAYWASKMEGTRFTPCAACRTGIRNNEKSTPLLASIRQPQRFRKKLVG